MKEYITCILGLYNNILRVLASNKDRFCKTIAAVALLTPKFKEICDCRQRKVSQAEIQNKRSRKVSVLKEGGYI